MKDFIVGRPLRIEYAGALYHITGRGNERRKIFLDDVGKVKKYNYTTGQTVLYFGGLYEIRSGVGMIHLFAGDKRAASVLSDGRAQFYHTNHLGSASVITDQNGYRKERMEYFPFGTYRESIDYDTNFPDVFYTFTGQEEDDDLGLYNYGERLYDPVLGKFISPDSIVPYPHDLQSLNRYSYVRNNPLHYTDPTGNYFDGGGFDLSGSDSRGWDLGGWSFSDMDRSDRGSAWNPASRSSNDTAPSNQSNDNKDSPDTSLNTPIETNAIQAWNVANNPVNRIDSLGLRGWFTVYATREGLVGQRTADGTIIKEYDIFVALPSRKALGREVELCHEGLNLVAPVKDVGPWNTNDPYWETNSRPKAELGISNVAKSGTAKNPAGIDLSDEAFKALGLADNDWISWRFVK